METSEMVGELILDELINSVAFSNAPRREANRQGISQPVRPAVSQTVSRASRQADRNTQFGFFFQWQTRLQAVGRTTIGTTRSGRVVKQPTAEPQSSDRGTGADSRHAELQNRSRLHFMPWGMLRE
jgi:hypothetical protein